MQVLSSQLADRIMEFLPEEERGIKQKKAGVMKRILTACQENLSRLKYSTGMWHELSKRDLTRQLTFNQKRAVGWNDLSAHEVNAFILTLQSKGGISTIAADLSNWEKFPLYTLIGHIKRGDVTQAQVASMCLLYQAIDQFIFNREHVAVYPVDASDPDSISNFYISNMSNAKPPKLHTYSIFDKKKESLAQEFFNLTDYGFKLFQERLLNKPDSEKYFHTVQLPLGPVYNWSPLIHRIITIAPNNSFHFFKPVEIGTNHILDAKITAMVVPSFSMIEEYLKVVHDENAIDLVPLIGECGKETITHYKLQNKRVFQIGMPEAPIPKMADNYYVGNFCFSLHDAYHAIRDSLLTQGARRAIGQIVDRILRDSKSKTAEKIKWNLIDGELYQKKNSFGELFALSKANWDEAHKQLVLEDMAKLSQFWEMEFGIIPDHLLENERKLYDAILLKMTEAEKQTAQKQLFNYYKSNARENDPHAQFRLGHLYYIGYGTPISYPDAIKHWKLSNTPRSLFNLSICYKKVVNPDPKMTFHYALLAAKAGHVTAQYNIGIYYKNGFGTEPNREKALLYFEKAAKGGDADAKIQLEHMKLEK